MKFLDLYFFPNKHVLTPDQWALWMKPFPDGAYIPGDERQAINDLRTKVGGHPRTELYAEEEPHDHTATNIYSNLCAFVPPAGAVLTNAIAHALSQIIADHPVVARDYLPHERYLPKLLCRRLGWYCYLSLWDGSPHAPINF